MFFLDFFIGPLLLRKVQKSNLLTGLSFKMLDGLLKKNLLNYLKPKIVTLRGFTTLKYSKFSIVWKTHMLFLKVFWIL